MHGRRLKVVLLLLERLFEPWCIDVVGARHDRIVYDQERFIETWFADIDVVIDHGGRVGSGYGRL